MAPSCAWAKASSVVQTGQLPFSPDGKHLAVASGIGIWIYDVETARELTLLNGGRPTLIRSVAYSPDGMILAAGTGDGKVQLWEVKRERLLALLIPPEICVLLGSMPLRFRPTGESLRRDQGMKSNSGMSKTNDTSKRCKGIRAESSLWNFLPTGKPSLRETEDDTVKLWEVATGKNLRISFEHSSDVLSVAFSPNRETLVTAASKSVKLWNISTKKNVATLKHTNHVKAVVLLAQWYHTYSQGRMAGLTFGMLETRKKIVCV